MSSLLLTSITQYFRPPEKYFWQWAEKGTVIEWRAHDGTICYREELAGILKDLADGNGWPPLGTILLVLVACKGDRHLINRCSGTLFAIYGRVSAHERAEERRMLLKKNATLTVDLLKVIQELPAELRTGDKRSLLLQTLFAKIEKIAPGMSLAMLSKFNSGELDNFIFKDGFPSDEETFFEDMACLADVSIAFPTAAALELKLRTGLDELPLPVPDIQLPEEEPTDLLDQLSKDKKTAGLASLTRRLIAALNIPMHAHGQSDQSFGGVSDISNRGNFDRLLLSELAHDDLSLMARLANNEALYLRREELPDDLDRERVILIDTTLKMWGMPRVFAIATALACTRNNKLNAAIHAWALGGKNVSAIDMASKAGVINVLSQLDPALHCGDALATVMKDARAGEGDEYFLITEDAAIHTEAFHKTIAGLKNPLSFLLTVNREGELQFYQFIKGRRKLLSAAKFDLLEILQAKEAPVQRKQHPHDMPAIFSEERFPLYYPTSKVSFSDTRMAQVGKGVVGVTTDQRVLYWPERSTGAVELMEYIEQGWYCFGYTTDQFIYILCYSSGINRSATVHQINVQERAVQSITIDGPWEQILDAGFSEWFFHVKAKDAHYNIDARSGKVFSTGEQLAYRAHRPGPNIHSIKKHVNNGYTVINTVRYMHVNQDSELTLGSRYLTIVDRYIKLINAAGFQHDHAKKTPLMRPDSYGQVSMSHKNKQVKFFRFTWKNGSRALFDSRGLLHLRSADKSIPEVTVVLVMNKPLAAWASDGRFCGAEYFIGRQELNSNHVTSQDFYNKYIQSFIEALR